MFARHILLVLLVLAPAGLFVRADSEIAESGGDRPRFKSPLGLAVDPAGKFACVALHTADALAVIDLKTYQVRAEIPVGRKPYDVALFRNVAYVSCEADDTVVAVDLAAEQVKKVFKVGQAPRGLAIDPSTGLIHVVCHDAKALYKLTPAMGRSTGEPIPPQPEGNFARATNVELIGGSQFGYKPTRRPYGLFTPGVSVFDPQPAAATSGFQRSQRTAFSPMLDLDYARTGMDMVAHTRPRWFTPTTKAPDSRIFTNAFSFFLNASMPAAVVLLDEPDKGYPDPTDVVVKLPRNVLGGRAAPLDKNGTADKHPFKGARVFIASGGADTVVVLDLHKAAKHFEAHPPAARFGPLGGGGNFGGGFPGAGGFAGGNGFGRGGGGSSRSGTRGGSSAPASARTSAPAPAAASSGAQFGGNLGGGFNLGGAGFAGGYAGGFGGGGWGAGFGGNFGGGFGGNFGGWGGGFGGFQGFGWGGGLGPFNQVPEDLRASANYTLARLPTQANPRRMALTPDLKTLIVSNHLADSLTLIDTDKLTVLRHISLGGPKPDAARRGQMLFHSAKFTFQQQFTCASCHPGGGSDGLAWDTSAKPTGEHLNTRALHGVGDTAPFGWRGESETLVARIKNTMREVHRHDIADDDAADIAAFLKTLAPPRPLPQDLKAMPAIARGKALFVGKAGCNRCHRDAVLTSDTPRAVIPDHKGEMTPFDVPSLRGVGRTAPYLHDGRAATLEEIFEQHNPKQQHGNAHRLSRTELGDLVAFLKSL
jgi:YVTN family beta-propeller protein